MTGHLRRRQFTLTIASSGNRRRRFRCPPPPGMLLCPDTNTSCRVTTHCSAVLGCVGFICSASASTAPPAFAAASANRRPRGVSNRSSPFLLLGFQTAGKSAGALPSASGGPVHSGRDRTHETSSATRSVLATRHRHQSFRSPAMHGFLFSGRPIRRLPRSWPFLPPPPPTAPALTVSSRLPPWPLCDLAPFRRSFVTSSYLPRLSCEDAWWTQTLTTLSQLI
jgi:hypothetical protein